jgi:hypothetical protein
MLLRWMAGRGVGQKERGKKILRDGRAMTDADDLNLSRLVVRTLGHLWLTRRQRRSDKNFIFLQLGTGSHPWPLDQHWPLTRQREYSGNFFVLLCSGWNPWALRRPWTRGELRESHACEANGERCDQRNSPHQTLPAGTLGRDAAAAGRDAGAGCRRSGEQGKHFRRDDGVEVGDAHPQAFLAVVGDALADRVARVGLKPVRVVESRCVEQLHVADGVYVDVLRRRATQLLLRDDKRVTKPLRLGLHDLVTVRKVLITHVPRARQKVIRRQHDVRMLGAFAVRRRGSAG